jgi:ribonucleotide reductase alpha subunit
MKTMTINIYSYKELSEKAKERARDKWRETALDYQWWEFTYEDAENIGIKITEFDTYRGTIKGHFTESADFTANKILSDHGDKCSTWAEANHYRKTMDEFMANAEKDEYGELATYKLDNEKEEIEDDFLHSMLGEYLKMLRDEYEYQMSDEVIEECIIMNDPEYLENGNFA